MGTRKPADEVDMRVMRDFVCSWCENRWEDRLKMAEIKAGEAKCPKCGEEGVPQMSACGIDSHAAASWRR